MLGQMIEDRIEDHNPESALAWLKRGYRLNRIKLAVGRRDYLPSQNYLSKICMDAILNPLVHPERSCIVNIFMPGEVLQSFSLYPQFCEAFACYLNGTKCERVFIDWAEANGVPETFCSYHKTLIGAAEAGLLPKPRFIASTTMACDANINTFRRLSEHYDCPLFIIDTPTTYDVEAVSYLADQLRALVDFIAQNLHEKPDLEKLIASIRRANRANALYRQFLETLQTKEYPNNMTLEMYRIIPLQSLLGSRQSTEYFRLSAQDIKQCPDVDRTKTKRILWMHTLPFYQPWLKNFFADGKYNLVLCDLNFVNPLEPLDEAHPYEAIAKKLLTNTFNGRFENRIQAVLQMAQNLEVDGVIQLCHWGCKQSSGGAFLAKNALEENGFPVLVLDGDGIDGRNLNEGQLRTRIEAFKEMLGVAR